MNRVEAIERIFTAHPGAFFILSNGLTSREAAHFLPRPDCLYLLHAMGEALSVGIGLAQADPSLEVVVIDGDGNALMGLASWSMMPVANLHYYILANGLFETTGGQALPALPFVPPWCRVLQVAPGKAQTPNPPPPEQIWGRCMQWLQQRKDHQGGPHGR